MYYFGRLGMKEIGPQLGVCEGQVSRRLAAALGHARRAAAARVEP